MSYNIRKFDTISRHQAKLTQKPSVIRCLAAVLKYIKEVLEDDGTQTLFQLIEGHLTTKDHTAHHINLKLLSIQILNEISSSFNLSLIHISEPTRPY